MGKDAYLKELSRHLSRWMPAREKEDTLRWYEEYLQDAGPEREAGIIEELGPPDALAHRLAEEGGWIRDKPRRSKGMVIGTAVAALLVAAALCVGIWGALRPDPDGPSAGPDPSVGQEGPVQPSATPPQSGSPAPTGDPAPSHDPAPSNDPAPSQSQLPADGPQALDAFQGVDVDIAVGDVTIRTGADFQIEVEARGTVGSEPYRIEYEVTGDVLKVVSSPRPMDSPTRDLSARMTITVPADQTLETVQVYVDVGDVALHDLTAGKIDLRTDVGDASVTGSAADSIDLDADVGTLSVTGSVADSIKLDSDTGDLKLTGAPAAIMELTTDTGDITVHLDYGLDQCSYQLSTDTGDIRAGQMTASRGSLTHAPPGALYQLTGCTDVGDISLTFGG